MYSDFIDYGYEPTKVTKFTAGLKKNEAFQYKIEWSATRLLSKVNYIVHTDAVKNCIVPTLTEKQKKSLLNITIFI